MTNTTHTPGIDLDKLTQRLRAQSRAPFGPEGFALLAEAADAIEAIRQAEPEAPTLTDADLDDIASNYFAEGYAQQKVKDAIHDAFTKAKAPATQQAEAATCGMCNDSGIVGFPPDQYESCPDCTPAASSQFAKGEHTAATTASASGYLEKFASQRYGKPIAGGAAQASHAGAAISDDEADAIIAQAWSAQHTMQEYMRAVVRAAIAANAAEQKGPQ